MNIDQIFSTHMYYKKVIPEYLYICTVMKEYAFELNYMVSVMQIW